MNYEYDYRLQIDKLKIIGNRFTIWMTLKVNYRLKILKKKYKKMKYYP